MRWRTTLVAVLAGWILAAAPALAQAEKDALKIIPDDSLGFILLNRLEQTSGKIQVLAKRLKLPLPFSPLGLVKLTLGIQKGLNEKGSVAVAILPGADDDSEPIPMMFIPVTDYKDFIASFNPKEGEGKISEIQIKDKAHVVGKKGDYAVLADLRHADALKKVLAGTGNVSASVASLHGWLGENDVAAVVTTRGIKTIVKKGRQGLEMAKAATANLPQELQFLNNLVEGLDKFLENVGSEIPNVVAGAQVDADGNLHLAAKAQFSKGGSFAKIGSGVKAPEGGPLAGLPGGPYVLAGGGVYSDKTMEKLVGLGLEMMKIIAKDLPAEQLKKLDHAYSQMFKGMRSMAIEYAVGKPGEPLFSNLMGAIKVDDAGAYLDRYEKSMRTLNEVIKDANVPFFQPYEIKRTKVGGAPALEIINDFSGNPGIAAVPEKIIEGIFGKTAKMTVSMAVADEQTIITRYTSAAGLKEVLHAYKKKTVLAEDADIAKTAALLPRGFQWALYVSPKGLMELSNRIITDFAPQVGIQLPAFPRTPPIGMAIRISGDGIGAHLVVPGAVLEGIGEIIPKLKGPAEAQ